MKVPAFWHSLTIFQKLMTIFLSLTIVLLASTLFLARWSFEQGFLDYVNALEQTRLQMISRVLIQKYEKEEYNWRKIPAEELGNIINSLPMPKGPDTPDGIDIPMQVNGQPVPHVLVLPGARRKRPEAALFDRNGVFVAGEKRLLDKSIKKVYVPIIVNGEKIGELRSIPVRHFRETLPTQYSRKQWELSIWVGSVGLLIAVFISWFLAFFLSRTFKGLMGAIARLSNGDYSVQLKSQDKDEIGQLINNVNQLAKTLDSSRESRRHWLANISHDLRTPITILSGEIQSLKDGVRSFNQERLCSLEQEVNHLQKLTDDLYQLSISEIGGLRYEFIDISLDELLKKVVLTFEGTAIDYGLTIECFLATTTVLGDASRLTQLFSNMISNSIAYTDVPGTIAIHLYISEDKAIVEIEDSAPGVPEESYAKLFDPLYRQDTSRNRRKEGSGLGLAICMKIAEAHQGKITASPSDLGGLKLQFVMPVFVMPLF